MNFNQPLASLIAARHSCRSFDGSGLDADMLVALEKHAANVTPPFQSRLRVGVIDGQQVRAENFFSTGSYGLIQGARFYLSALARRSEPRLFEDIAFVLEAAVLFATDRGLGSCWIGGVFDRGNFGRALAIGGDEILPAVIAIGRPAERRSLRDRLVRWGAKGDMRKNAAEIFFCADWQTPWTAANGPRWAPVLEGVRLGPSASNKQPWRIIASDCGFHFFLSRHKAYSAMMPFADLQRMDMGIAMCHFQLGAAELGLAGEWQEQEPKIPNTPANFEYIVTFVIR